MSVAPIDPRAKKILFDTHWTSKGWIDRGARQASPSDRAYAKRHGLMFDPFTGTHDQLVAKLKGAVKAISPREVCNAFLSSLSTRRPDLRSGLATWAFANDMKRHRFTAGEDGPWCAACGALATYRNEDLDVLNFERHKWGGVRHVQPLYQYVDLVALRRALPATPTPEDHAIWARILAVIDRMPARDGPTKLSQRLKDVLPSAKDERDQLLEVLAIVGILAARTERTSPGEWSHVGMWRGADRYNTKIANALFGKPERASRGRIVAR